MAEARQATGDMFDWALALFLFVSGYYTRVFLKTLKEKRMSKFISLMITLVVSMFALNAMAFDPPPAPSDGTYVVDLTGKLSATQKTQLNNKIEQMNRSTKNEFGILLLADMGGDNIEDVANATYKKWGVGKRGLDNGCLIVVALKERKSRIETGKGVEGDVPDLKAVDILKKNLNPHLKSGDFYGGFDDTLNALSSQIESRHAQKADPPPASNPVTEQPVTNTGRTSTGGCSMTDSSSPFSIGLFILACIIGGILLARRGARKAAERMRQAEEDHREDVARRQREDAVRIAQARVAENFKRDRDEAERMRLEREARNAKAERERLSSMPTPMVAIPVVQPRTVTSAPRPTATVTKRSPVVTATAAVAITAAASLTAAALLEEERKRAKRKAEERAEEARTEARREEERREAKRRSDREDEDRRRRQREDDDRRSSSSSSSSSSDWGGSSSGGSGFGGGDSGGGGGSSDW